MIQVRGLHKSHRGQPILRGIDLTVHEGEVTVLVGPSGGGKSTLLRCLNGLETFDRGDVEAFGVRLQGRSGMAHPKAALLQLRQRVGMVFQQFHLFPHQSVLENVALAPQVVLGHSAAEAEAGALRWLARVGLSEKASARPSELSGGQQQRVAIARTLAVNPKAILFDEPTSALDPVMAREVLAVFRDLATERRTMIVVTHDMELARAATVAHRMEAGRIARTGTPEEVLGESP